MTLFQNKSGNLKEIKEKPLKLEKDIQKIFEKNIQSIMGLQLVKSEFIIKNRRIDTLAFDMQSKAFIIIEYKRGKNISVIDQGFTYLGLMLENKADFIIEYNESLKKNLKREEVDWSQTRVVFVSTDFTEDQLRASNFKDIAIELWEIKQFENNTILINSIKKSQSAPSIKPITQQNKELKCISEEIKVYTEQDLIDKATEEIAELYEKFKNAILNLSDGIELIPLKFYVAFKKETNITDIVIQNKTLKIFINAPKGKLDDPKKIAKDVSKIGHLCSGNYQIQVDNDKNLEYIMSLIKQVI